MTDLHSQLTRIAGPAAAPTPETVDADLDRGRRALHRRRTRQAAAGSAFAVAAIAGAMSFATLTGAPSTPDAPPAVGFGAAGQPMADTRIVPYDGAQPKAFDIAAVPEGWYIQGSDSGTVVIAPDKAKNPGPDVNPSTQPLYDPQNYTGKITVMLQSRDQTSVPEGTRVTVGGKPGVLVKSEPGETPDGPRPTPADGDTGWTLWVEQPSGVHLLVQFWDGLGFDQDEMVAIGAGVTVKKGAQQGVG